MKNIGFLLVLALSCMFLTSCSQPPVESQSNHAEGAAAESTLPVYVNNEQDYKINKRQFIITDEVKNTSGQTQRSTSINITYPEITGMNHTDVQERINNILFSFPIEQFLLNTSFSCGDGFQLQMQSLTRRNVQAENSDLEINVSYHVLRSDNQILSIAITGYSVFNRINYDAYYLTFNLVSGDLISLLDLAEQSTILSNISEGAYTVLEGSYYPGGWQGHESDVRESFYTVVREMIDNFGQNESSYCELNNVGIGATGLYFCFDYEDSLRGYVVLSIPISSIFPFAPVRSFLNSFVYGI